MNRFFVASANVHENHIIIDGSDVNHIKNVLRLKTGDTISICAGNNMDYICKICEYRENSVWTEIVEKTESDHELGADIYLFQGLPKSDKMELIIQKCVELGVHEIIPVAMKRCVVKLDDKKASGKILRWQAISESAAKQSGRTIIPVIHEPVTFMQAVSMAAEMELAMIPYEMAEGMEATKQVLSKIEKGMKVAVFIGPEGGFDPDEVEKAYNAGITPVSLGKRILRTETAGLAVMAIIMYHLETKDR